MGADIHALVERKIGEKWIMINRCKGEAMRRNYVRFAALADVRGDGPSPKGLPEDLSDSGKLYAEEWDGDAHSHSFLNLDEAAKIFLATDPPSGDWGKKYPCAYYFDIEDENAKEHRLVFWFDN